jgi:hypothetical protein
VLPKQVGQAALEWGLRSNHRQIDLFLGGKGEDRGRVEDVDGTDQTQALDSRIPRCCNNLRAFLVGQEPPDQSVFAAP